MKGSNRMMKGSRGCRPTLGRVGRDSLPIVLALPFLLIGCGSVGLGDSPEEELERNRTLWDSVEPAAYSYQVGRLCFCTVESLGPVRVVVEDGIPIERTYVDTGDPVGAQFAALFPAVEGLFDILADAYERDASEVQVTFDPTTGVPIEISIDYILNAADDELGITATPPVQPLQQD